MTDRATEVQAWLGGQATPMRELLEALVAVPTENPPGRELGRCARLLFAELQTLGFEAELIGLEGADEQENPAVVRASLGSGPEVVYFHGHFDVVPAQQRSQFEPRRRAGRIYGRGTADMKGGLVSMIFGALAAAEGGLLEGRRIVLHYVCDEETGSTTGSGHLRAAGLIDSDAIAMLTAEPTGGVIWHANRGAITLRVSVTGREAHVGHAHLGVNAFEHLIHIAAPLAALAHELQHKRTGYRLESEQAAGSMLVIGGQTGAGANFNVVPGCAWFSIDRRFNPEEDLEEEMLRLADVIRRAANEIDADVQTDVLQCQPAADTNPEHPAARTLASCVRAITGVEPSLELCPGVLDTRWYAQLGIPAFAYGGGRLDVSHGPREYIEETAMRSCAEVYAAFAVEVRR